MQATQYDVVIMGAGFAGICQARHLMLNVPNLKIALIDPRPADRQDKDMKVGESTVEIAALFLSKELGLHEYMIENHTPKHGLHFHWPKESTQTDNLEDYYHVWSNRNTAIPTFHMNRAKFEGDVLKMTIEMGVTFINGRVADVDLTLGEELHTVHVKVAGENLKLTARHLIDAGGRNFIIGRRTDNIIDDQEGLFGVDTGTAWVRVRNIDRDVFDSGYHPERASSSCYYATNHFFGQGHWLWMIPSDSENLELSIGVIHHHDVIPANTVNTEEKFHAFLKANHNLLYRIIESGENVDFHYRPKVAYKSKKMFSEDNWYVIGDAAYIFDAFYSYGTSTIALAAEAVTEIIRAKLAGEPDAERKQEAYNKFNLTYADNVNYIMRDHKKQLGHASIMSWRIYFEYMWWFGLHVPMYVGKWHLDITFVDKFVKRVPRNLNTLFADIYEQFNQLIDRNANIGLMDCYRGDQLVFGYYTLKNFDDFLENTKLEPRRCNVFACIKTSYFYIAIWYVLFQWKGFGLAGILNPRHIRQFGRLLMLLGQAIITEQVYKSKVKHLAANSQIEAMREEFKSYRYQPELQNWMAQVSTPEIKEETVSEKQHVHTSI
jgi:flavin-dependent dehydrogenase